jgi:hypothetical protein
MFTIKNDSATRSSSLNSCIQHFSKELKEFGLNIPKISDPIIRIVSFGPSAITATLISDLIYISDEISSTAASSVVPDTLMDLQLNLIMKQSLASHQLHSS